MVRPASSGARPKSSASTAAAGRMAAATVPASGAAAVEDLLHKVELLEAQRAEEARTRNLMQLERVRCREMACLLYGSWHNHPSHAALANVQDQVQAYWEVTKRELEEVRGAARLAARGLEEAQDAHALELKLYRQKVGMQGRACKVHCWPACHAAASGCCHLTTRLTMPPMLPRSSTCSLSTRQMWHACAPMARQHWRHRV